MEVHKAHELYLAAVHDIDRQRAHDLVKELLNENMEPEVIIYKVVAPALETLVQAFIDEKIILSQHFIATKISEEIIDQLLPTLKLKQTERITMIIGCAQGDFHGLGKKIVIGTVKAKMIDVYDLGLNVKPERFIEKALEVNAQIIGVSSMMVHTALGENGPKKVRDLLKEQDLENKIKLIVGGAPYKFDENLYKQVHADAWASNGLEAAEIIEKLVKSMNYVN